MALREALGAFVEHRDDVAERLEADQQHWDQFVELCNRLAAATDDEDRQECAFGLVMFLSSRLPSDHPVIAALLVDSVDLGDVQELDAELIEKLRIAIDELEPDIVGQVRAMLLKAPAQTAGQLRSRGVDPDTGDLIRLVPDAVADSDREIESRFPAFQFDAGGNPLPVVVRINVLLDAAADPWGVACWWLDGNAWLGNVPARLLGKVDDELLVDAARAELED